MSNHDVKKLTINISGEDYTIDVRDLVAAIQALGAAANKDVANNLTTTQEGAVLDARQGKILDDKFGNYILASAIKNNLAVTAAGSVLDARQGKILNDRIEALGVKTIHESDSDKKVVTYQFPGGLLITTMQRQVTMAMTEQVGQVYQASISGFSWPISYASTPTVIYDTHSVNGNCWSWGSGTASTTSTGGVYFARPTSRATVIVWLDIIGIGYSN